MLFWRQPLILPFLCHRASTTCQIDSNKVSKSKLKPYLCNCVKTETIEHIRFSTVATLKGRNYFGTPCFYCQCLLLPVMVLGFHILKI